MSWLKDMFKPPKGYLLASFVKSQWTQSQRPTIGFILFNVIASFYTLGWIMYSIIEDNTWKWLIFMTNWSATLILIETFLRTILVLNARITFKEEKYSQSKLPWIHIICWILLSVNVSAALTVTTVYWIFLYDASYFKSQVDTLGPIHGNAIFAKSIHLHGINAVYMVIKLFVVAVPIKISHIIFPNVLAFVYIIFSLVYHFLGGTNSKGEPFIYNILNWKHPWKTLGIVFGIMIILSFMYMAGYGLFRFRVFLADKLSKSGNKTENSK